jgi:hypothetical protein
MNVPIDRTRANEIHGVDIFSQRGRLGLLGWYFFAHAGLFRRALSRKACGTITMGIRYPDTAPLFCHSIAPKIF